MRAKRTTIYPYSSKPSTVKHFKKIGKVLTGIELIILLYFSVLTASLLFLLKNNAIKTMRYEMVQIDVLLSNQIFHILEEWETLLQGLGSNIFSEIAAPEF